MNRPGLKGYFVVTLLSIIIFSSNYKPGVFLQSQLLVKKSSSSTDLINEVNSLRISNGLPIYQINQTLMFIAQNHSDYQASIGATTHYGPDGSRPFQRALSAGYLVAGDLNLGGFFSENIVAGRNLSASDAVNSWQSDTAHLNTMLSSSLQDIGAGVTVVGDTIYYTIDVGLSTSGKLDTTQEVGIIPTYNPNVGRKILTSTPGIDGSIYHIVDFGETIWTISQVYKISQEEFIQINSLTDNFIYVGDKFLIRPPFTPTPTTPAYTPTQRASLTPSLSPTIQPKSTNTEISSPTMDDPKPSKQDNVILIIIISLTLLSSGLFTFIGKKRSNK